MHNFIKTEHIMSSTTAKNSRIDQSQIVGYQDWDYTRVPSLEDIEYWQVIYYTEDTIGVFAAENPYVEYYVIVHYAFSSIEASIEQFYGVDASDRCYSRLKKFGLTPSLYTSWSNLVHSQQP